MDTLQWVGSTLGLSFLAGIRLYATVLLLGLAIRFQLIHLSAGLSHLQVLAQPVVLIASGVACVLEFFSDKIPLIDSTWDAVHTFIRPVGAVVLALTASASMDPALKFVIVMLSGGIALASHSSKAATRVAINHSPEPFSNGAVSLIEDALIPAGLWIVMSHPVIALVALVVFLALFAWAARRVVRLVRSRFRRSSAVRY